MNRVRQRLVLLSALSMIAVLCCACGIAKRWTLPEQTEREAQTAATVSEEPQTTVCSENTTAWTTLAETTTEAMEEIPFYPYSCSITDSNGYRIEQVLSVSPWISQNDSSALNAAWSRVSRGKPFPSLGEMGISNNYVISGFGKNYIEFDEVLFAVGTIDMYNRTEGFPIASSNPYSAAFYLYGANRFNTLTVLYGNGSRTYYSVAGVNIFVKFFVCLSQLQDLILQPIVVLNQLSHLVFYSAQRSLKVKHFVVLLYILASAKVRTFL